MNYQKIFDRFNLKLNGAEGFTKEQKITMRIAMTTVLWEQMDEDKIILIKKQNDIGDIRLNLINEVDFKRNTNNSTGKPSVDDEVIQRLVILGKQGSGKSVLARDLKLPQTKIFEEIATVDAVRIILHQNRSVIIISNVLTVEDLKGIEKIMIRTTDGQNINQ